MSGGAEIAGEAGLGMVPAARPAVDRPDPDEKPPLSQRRSVIVASRILLLLALLAAWEYGSGRWVRAAYVSKPTLVAERLFEWIATGEIWEHLLVTLQEAVIGFVAGAAAGFTVGLALGRNEFLAQVLNPFIAALNALPKVALAPLFILWFGIGLQMKVVLAVTIVFFLVFYNTFTGVRDVEEDLVHIVKTMGASRWDILRKILIPSALLWVFTGLRISIPYALIGAVVGEIFASNKGLGYLIQSSGAQFDTAGVFAGLILLVIVSSAFGSLLTQAERWLLRWRAPAPGT